ncbi:putative membrane protein [Amphibacillus marinus]|uniref:Putative membrane protein n=2 Tax=Amphibacillus marinus TaxID=872970 RepID=A0A1H8JTC7_9BACI|nr:putative membrane protein [Amphibacillus marinus]
MFESKRLHISALFFRLFKILKESLWLFLSAFFVYFNIDGYEQYIFIAIGVFVIISLLYSWLSWWRFTYMVNTDGLLIEKGIFIRQKRSIAKQRIQSINFNQNILHRLLGLTELQIETAGRDMKVDAKLTSLSMTDAQAIRKLLKQFQVNDEDGNSYDYDFALERKLPKYEASYKHLFLFGSTSGGLGVLMSILFIFGLGVEEFIPEQIIDFVSSWLTAQSIITLIILSTFVLLLFWLAGVIGSVIKYGDFTVVRYEDEILITRGLWEKKQLTFPLKRIQGVVVKQNLLRLPLRFATIYLEIAGGEADQKESMRTILFPLIKKKEIAIFLAEILPEYTYMPEQVARISRRYLYLNIGLASLLTLVVGLVVWYLLSLPYLLLLVFLIPSFLYIILEYQVSGCYLNGQQLTLQSWGWLSKETILLKRPRIQAMSAYAGLIQRRLGYANIKASILNNFLGRHYLVRGIKLPEIERVQDWYSYAKKE